MRTRPALVLALLLFAVSGYAQPSMNRERAKPHYLAGWNHMKVEAWPEAARAFGQAIEADPEFEDAYYGLGRANMALKKYGDAVAAYARCRDLYRAAAGRHFSSHQEAQRYRQDRLTQIDELLRLQQSAPPSGQAQERMRQLVEQRRQLHEIMQRGGNITIEHSVPAFVYLALGSAYFRLEQWPDAEREYKAAVDADPKTGEAHNNLAVVYLQMGRYREADQSLKAAERAGFKVNPRLKDDIKAKVGSN